MAQISLTLSKLIRVLQKKILAGQLAHFGEWIEKNITDTSKLILPSTRILQTGLFQAPKSGVFSSSTIRQPNTPS